MEVQDAIKAAILAALQEGVEIREGLPFFFSEEGSILALAQDVPPIEGQSDHVEAHAFDEGEVGGAEPRGTVDAKQFFPLGVAEIGVLQESFSGLLHREFWISRQAIVIEDDVPGFIQGFADREWGEPAFADQEVPRVNPAEQKVIPVWIIKGPAPLLDQAGFVFDVLRLDLDGAVARHQGDHPKEGERQK